MEEAEIEREYKEITQIAEQRWEALERLEQAARDFEETYKEAALKAHYWTIGEDGLVDVGLGLC